MSHYAHTTFAAAACAAIAFCAMSATAGFEPTGCAEFMVEQPQKHGGVVVKATDFGMSTANVDNAPAINRALEECRRVKADRLELAPGTYRCHGPVGVVMEGIEDLVVDGKDALLVFWRKDKGDWDADTGGPVGGDESILVKNCRRVRIEHLKMDWDWSVAPLGFFGVCVNKHVDEKDNESYVDFEIPDMEKYPLYPNPVPVQLIQPMSKDRTNGRLEGGHGRCYCGSMPGHFGCRNEWLSPTRLRVWVYVPQAGRPQAKHELSRFSPDRNRQACSSMDLDEMYGVCHYYYGMNGVTLDSNEHVTLRDFKIWSCRGAGLMIQGTQKYTLLYKFRLAPPDPEEVRAAGAGGAYLRCQTSTADGTHVKQCRGYVMIVGCEWAMHNDDSVNFHDCTTIARAEGQRKLRVVNNNGTKYLAAEVGAELELRQEDYAKTGWTGKIVAMDDRTFTVDRDLPRQKGLFFVVYNRMYSTEHLLFRKCRFHGTPWARNVILGSNVTFDNCRFEGMLNSPLKFQACYNYNVWCEGAGCTNVVVKNCTFSNCADYSQNYMPNGISAQIYCGVRIPGSRGWPEMKTTPIWDAQLKKAVDERLAKGPSADVVPAFRDVLSGILVENNTFVNPRGYVWHAENGDNLIFRDNKVVFDGMAPYTLKEYAGKLKSGPGTKIKTADRQK
ncbi:MAG: hypothetical protein IJI73_06345 [Kiritimatiellae bacterium]|nr:hypothetical protein [Kiritimatiellia bacterium]